MATFNEQQLILHFMSMAPFFTSIPPPVRKHHILPYTGKCNNNNNKRIRLSQIIRDEVMITKKNKDYESVDSIEPAKRNNDCLPKKPVASLKTDIKRPTRVLLTQLPNTYDNLYTFQLDIWNKPFKTIVESNFYRHVVLAAVNVKFGMFRNQDERMERFRFFLEAGQFHTDFVQLSLEMGVADFSGKCMFCNQHANIVIVSGTHVKCDRFGRRSKTNAKDKEKHNSEPCFRIGKDCCLKTALDIIDIYHHIWAMSKPLKGYLYQGFAMMPTPQGIAYGSSNPEEVYDAYNRFKRVLKGHTFSGNQIERLIY
jgi:hypothetical protein